MDVVLSENVKPRKNHLLHNLCCLQNRVSKEFWEAIGGKISKSMDFKVGTADGQSDGLQVLGLGEPWLIYLEGMEECFILEPLVIQGLSHSVNLGISFLMEHNLKINCMKEEVALMPVKDRST